jgi:hypothetical protein
MRSRHPVNDALPYWPAALRLEQAAAYVGLSVDTFKEVCPVEPTRGHRYLRASLDNWLVSLDPNGSNSAATKRRIGEKIGGQGESVRS